MFSCICGIVGDLNIEALLYSRLSRVGVSGGERGYRVLGDLTDSGYIRLMARTVEGQSGNPSWSGTIL